MKFATLLFGLLWILPPVSAASAAAAAAPSPEATPLVGEWDFQPDPALPNVLLLGDSISIGYTLGVRARLRGQANVFRPLAASRARPENCRDTRFGFEQLDGWISGRKWDLIHFNWGLWDLCYRNPAAKNSGNRDKAGGTLAVPLEEYARNLEQIVGQLAQTGAILVWANTTVVPPDEPGRFVGDDRRYNAAAAAIMERRKIVTDDLHTVTAAFPPAYFRAPADVHPNEEGMSRLADVVAAALQKTLARRAGKVIGTAP